MSSGLMAPNTVVAGPPAAGPSAFGVPRLLVFSDLPPLPASGVVVIPAGGITSINVQTALVELDTKKAAISSLANVALSGAGVDLITNGVAWTPALTFATPGDLAVAYATRIARYWQISTNLVLVQFNIVTSSFTFTTASGALQISGLPFTSNSTVGLIARGALTFGGINKAGYSQVMGAMGGNVSVLGFNASGMGQTPAAVTATDTPTGGTMTLVGEMLIFL